MGFKQSEVDELLALTGRRCCLCKKLHTVQVHHITPKEKGGTDDIDNAIPLCPNCHNEVHSSFASGRTTRAYTAEELKHHRDETIKRVKIDPGSKQTLRLILQKAKVFRVKSPAENRALVTIFITPNPTYLRKDTCSCFLTVPDIIKAQELPVYEFLETSVNVEKTDKREKADLNVKGPGYFEVHARASSVDATIPEDYTGPVQLTFRCVPEGPAGPMLTEEVNLTWVPEEGKPGGVWRYPTSQEEADDTGTQQEAEPKKLPKGTDITLNPRDPVFSVSAWQGGIPVENGWLTVMLDPANQGHEAGHITEISIENITTNSPLVGDTPMREVQYYRDNFPHGSEQVYLPIEVPPRTRDIALKLRIELPLSFENPQDFAAMLGRLGSYQLTVRYVYEDVDRKRFEDTVEVPASFERFKSDRMNEWEQNKLFELLAIARAANG